MSDKIRPRQQRTPKKARKIIGLRAGHDSRIVPLRIRDNDELEYGFNVGHNLDEEWR